MAAEPEVTKCEYRFPDDDFFCEKYGVWYALRDCNYRVLGRTYEGCIQCFQGRVNLRAARAPISPGEAPVAPQLLPFPRRVPAPVEAPRRGDGRDRQPVRPAD